MNCKYTVNVKCACPVDGGHDAYVAVFQSASIIRVENILAALKPYETSAVYQEDLTSALARKLCCVVTTTGYHSGVITEVTAP